MKNLKRYLYFVFMTLFVFIFAFSLASCDEGNKESSTSSLETSSTTEESKESAKELLAKVKFEDVEFDYDGNEHTLEATNIPAGAKVVYKNNSKTNPGSYYASCTVTLDNEEVKLLAYLKINKLKSVLTVNETKNFINQGIDRDFGCTFNNDEQTPTFTYYNEDKSEALTEDCLYTPGKYQVKAIGKASKCYLESNEVWISVTVVESNYDVKFENQAIVADGNEHTLEATGNLPEGYTFAYENNKGTVKGEYLAKVFVKDPEGKVVETQYAVLSIDNPDNQEFNAYLKDTLMSLFDGDQSALNVFFEDFEEYGFTRFPAVWYKYEADEEQETDEEIKADFDHDYAELEAFDKATLSNKQVVAYDYIYNLLKNAEKTAYNRDLIYIDMNYVDQFGGYVADLADTIENYNIWTKDDISDIVSFLKSAKEAFPSYATYVVDKAEHGYPLSDYTIDKMVEVLDKISAQKTDKKYYLYDLVARKINNFNGITDSEKTTYINQVNDALDNYFMPAVEELSAALKQQKGKLADEDIGYLAKYENGKEIYMNKLRKLLGINDLDGDAYLKELKDYLLEYSDLANDAVQVLVKKYKITAYGEISDYFNNNPVVDGTPLEMLAYLKEFAKTIVRKLPDTPEITVKNMDDAVAENSNTMAYYRKSALGHQSTESITLNPKLLGDDKMELLSTLAHEGYPGHLYSYVLSKESGLNDLSIIMTNTGYGEGWATYVEVKLYETLMNNAKDQKQKDFLTYEYYNAYTGHVIYAIIDYLIFAENYTVKEVGAFLGDMGYNADAAQEIYDLLIEIPTQYASYGYGRMYFNKIHDKAKKELGSYYNEIDFNMAIQANGWTGLGALGALVDSYIANQKFLHGIVAAQ